MTFCKSNITFAKKTLCISGVPITHQLLLLIKIASVRLISNLVVFREIFLPKIKKNISFTVPELENTK